MKLFGSDYIVFGASRSGIAACKLLKSFNKTVYYYDDLLGQKQETALGEIGCIKLTEEDFPRLALSCEAVVVSPSVPLDHPLLKGVRGKVISEIELAASVTDMPIIAVTGTNGKSTTVSMIHSALRDASVLAGNIGLPFSSVSCGVRGKTAVLEISSYMAESFQKFRPNVAAFLNFSPDHLKRHKTMRNYFEAKCRLFACMDAQSAMILNYDDPQIAALQKRYGAKPYFFSLYDVVEKGCYIKNAALCFSDGKSVSEMMDMRQLPLKGTHNLQNALCAACCLGAAGVPPAQIAEGLENFQGLPHRLKTIRIKDGVTYINDSKSTNIDSTLAAANAVAGSTVLLLGGQGKGEDYKELFRKLPKNIVRVVIYGENAFELADAARSCAFSDYILCADMFEGLAAAKKNAEQGTNVLLSPASASFDAFEDFEDRGRQFEEAVYKL